MSHRRHHHHPPPCITTTTSITTTTTTTLPPPPPLPPPTTLPPPPPLPPPTTHHHHHHHHFLIFLLHHHPPPQPPQPLPSIHYAPTARCFHRAHCTRLTHQSCYYVTPSTFPSLPVPPPPSHSPHASHCPRPTCVVVRSLIKKASCPVLPQPNSGYGGNHVPTLPTGTAVASRTATLAFSPLPPSAGICDVRA
ncbi:hypothetical protein BZA05DRAFT_103769 [Tricharina praecox]|uniref:uncharacterized protein n=1 Tax=Tricharina praecox TaxID=43433 RepID=UPI00221E93AB|nr:uncharacterized protein BZA05DRAFT_103769 [Tricharina praecox]KAI5857699.1 hypothetical protein BZA05DRAFT_103769 [Tricharina praecox]